METFTTIPAHTVWSGEEPVPAIGARVRVKINGVGWGVVTAYFAQENWLGVMVKLDTVPAWLVAQRTSLRHDVDAPVDAFGAEVTTAA